jgi:hypothetical protein
MAALHTASHDGDDGAVSTVTSTANALVHTRVGKCALFARFALPGGLCGRSVPRKKTGINSDVRVNTTASACPTRTGQATHCVRN